MSSLNTDHLLDYFTDVEGLRETFTAYITAQELPKRIMVIHGIGGVGKSSLLRMFRLHCKSLKVPVALASGDESKLVPSILSDWGDDLIADHVSLPHFVQTLRRYHEVQAQVANKARESREKLGELVGKTAGRVAETATTVGFGAALGALIPGAGAVGGALTGMGVEALVGWLRGFLSKSDIDLILDPAKRLTEEFLDDLGRMKPKRRIVLMLDTFEQLSALDSWACDLAQRLPSEVLFVIAGRAMPKWSRMWPSWLGVAHVEELTPMTDDVMRELVRRYYATVRGGEPDASQVEAIVRFGRGLPMVAAAAVELWVEHGVEKFETIKAEVVADLVDRLKEGVRPELLPILEAAATLRWFNQEILREVTGTAEISQAYHELRRFPFVRSHTEGLALHDAMREIIDDHLRGDDPARYRTLHERAAAYFEAQTAVRVGAKAERNQLERLYHRVCADEEKGIALFQALAEELVYYRAFVRLRALLSDVNTYALEFDNSRLWYEYYNARLPHKEAHIGAAGRIYQAIGENAHAEVKLRAYALCDWGGILTIDKYLGEPGGAERATRVLQRSLGLGLLDSHLIQAFLWLGRIARYQGEWDQQQAYLERAIDFFAQQRDTYGEVYVYSELKRTNARRGLWKEFFSTHQRGVVALRSVNPQPEILKAELLGEWAWAWALAGRFHESEHNADQSLEIARSLGNDSYTVAPTRDLAWALGVQDRFDDANLLFDEILDINVPETEAATTSRAATLAFSGAILTRCQRYAEAEARLAEAQAIKDEIHAIPGTIEAEIWLGLAAEAQGEWDKAYGYYRSRIDKWKGYGSYYFECSALVGLVRVEHALGHFEAVPPLLSEAEQLAQRYEYHDHLASLRLTQACAAWDGAVPEWGSGFDAAQRYLQHALVHALRYNRFLLDEVLAPRALGTPLRPIIAQCLERGEEGRQMLHALYDWWQTGENRLDTLYPDTISLVPEGMTLLQAEQEARTREPGDNKPQASVIAQINAAL